ncbi:MAG: uroporphyrinogen-III C-methyltransferase [Stenotrophobium sp.]
MSEDTVSDSLSGLRVLVTRPAHQADSLCRMIEARGGKALRLPLLSIEPVTSAAVERQLHAARGDDWWIFTSTNAVQQARKLLPADWPAQLAAVGAATAAALETAGRDITTPQGAYSSEALLALPQFQAVSGQHILLVTGEGGLEVLAPALRERGATVEVAVVYRRLPLPYDGAHVAAQLDDCDAIIITSAAALEHLLRITPEDVRGVLLARPLIVPGARVRDLAVERGFRSPLMPEKMSDAAIIHTLEQAPRPKKHAQMTDQPSDKSSAKPGPIHGRSRWLPLLSLILLVALGLAGWRGWIFYRAVQTSADSLVHSVADMQSQLDRINDRVTDLAEAQRHDSTEVAAFGTRLDQQNDAVARLTEQTQGGQVREQLTIAEHLLMSANDRLLLEQDVDAALTALQLADSRIGALHEPRLFNVRKEIASERAALQAVPRPDLDATALTFSSLIARVPKLPLRARVPQHFETRSAQLEVPANASRLQRAWISIKQALSSIFIIRRNQGPSPQLLSADQEGLVYQVLELKLEGARTAMLRGDAISYRDLCGSASAWLHDYFRAADPGVLAAQAELERLKPLDLDPPLPDISRSLQLLRAQMDGPVQ